MKESPGTSRICPALKSFFSDKMGGILHHCNGTSKCRRLDPKLEKKLVESIKRRASSGKNTFRSINSIIMRFPQFKEGLRKIKGVFERYDEDSNGTIDREELKKCLETLQLHLTGKEIEDLFQSCDVDGEEGIQFNEFIVLLCLIYLLMEPSSPHPTSKMGSELEATFNTIVEAFLFFDKNGDGKLNRKEMVKAMNEASPWERSPGHITKTRFKELDSNKCGQVSFKEFLFALINWVGFETDNEEELSI
ncbi:hypothetical protein AQUCO_03400136v1 [Aquilegia coerulea]|uniref:EF-hand domain-containing protein n=1 Tax=Aquilegia coerulea TaxID=218851 RepID=A0A2G5CXT1_AQUCA|nr:hypothetical protein AQUCO_03400136v1 [Aquilegia coerulea]